MLCGIFNVKRLPVASTYGRYLDSRQINQAQICDSKTNHFTGMKDHTIRIARLKLLMIAAKLVKSGNRDKVKYPIHDTKTPGLLKFYKFLDRLRFEKYQECKV
jgi:hypothetical protein